MIEKEVMAKDSSGFGVACCSGVRVCRCRFERKARGKARLTQKEDYIQPSPMTSMQNKQSLCVLIMPKTSTEAKIRRPLSPKS